MAQSRCCWCLRRLVFRCNSHLTVVPAVNMTLANPPIDSAVPSSNPTVACSPMTRSAQAVSAVKRPVARPRITWAFRAGKQGPARLPTALLYTIHTQQLILISKRVIYTSAGNIIRITKYLIREGHDGDSMFVFLGICYLCFTRCVCVCFSAFSWYIFIYI